MFILDEHLPIYKLFFLSLLVMFRKLLQNHESTTLALASTLTADTESNFAESALTRDVLNDSSAILLDTLNSSMDMASGSLTAPNLSRLYKRDKNPQTVRHILSRAPMEASQRLRDTMRKKLVENRFDQTHSTNKLSTSALPSLSTINSHSTGALVLSIQKSNELDGRDHVKQLLGYISNEEQWDANSNFEFSDRPQTCL